MRLAPWLLYGSWIALVGASAPGCATYLPQLHLETPEATGSEKIGRAELAGSQGGFNLSAAPEIHAGSTDADGNVSPDVPYLQTSWANYFLGFVKGLGDWWDLGVRFQPNAPLLVRVKFQFLGEPESRAPKWNFSLSALLSPGFTMAPGAESSPLIYFSADAAVLAGIRFNDNHLLWLAPHFTFASVSGLATTAGGASGTVLGYGGGLGYQLTVLGFFGRAEFVWSWGSAGPNQAAGPAFGALLGLRI